VNSTSRTSGWRSDRLVRRLEVALAQAEPAGVPDREVAGDGRHRAGDDDLAVRLEHHVARGVGAGADIDRGGAVSGASPGAKARDG
jgi:hypothetical protein